MPIFEKSLILDAVLVLFFLLPLFEGYKRGFTKTVLGIAFLFVSVLGARILYVPLGDLFYDNYFKKIATDFLASQIEKYASSLAEKQSGAVSEILPLWVSSLGESLTPGFENIVSGRFTGDFSAVADMLMDKVFGSAVRSLSTIIVFALVAVCLRIVFAIVTEIIIAVLKITGLRSADKLFGGVFGAVKGACLVVLDCIILSCIASIFPDSAAGAVIQGSHIVSEISKLDIAGLLGLLQ